MKMAELAGIYKPVLGDIGRVLESVDQREVFQLVDAVVSARHVYAFGAGRSLCAAGAFSRRLCQCGIDSYSSGDTNTPPAGEGDILIACSASGGTAGVLCAAERAKTAGCGIACITAGPDSPLAEKADITVRMELPPRPEFPQPLGSLFEQSAFVLFDCMVVVLMDRLRISEDYLAARHSNLE
jgi:6-phospho-3-hexuloisomerase